MPPENILKTIGLSGNGNSLFTEILDREQHRHFNSEGGSEYDYIQCKDYDSM
ncbi:hypothetical protein CBFG_00183 [Clostridiales bacterium 1_7_47FAA]|nr:hypothetical protein CBFG_00183 [Clostridiales bacterium 1_7_47FAA]